MHLEDEFHQRFYATHSAELIDWNRKIFAVLGLWPLKINDYIFSFYFVYLAVHCCLEYAELFQYIDDLEYVVANLTENAILTMILCKIGVYRLKRHQLTLVINAMKEDYAVDDFKTPEERKAFLKYNSMAKMFVKITMPLIFIAAVLYYLMPLTGRLAASKAYGDNTSSPYQLPYRTRLFFEVTELHTYILVYVCQVPIVPIVTFGYTGTDCLLVTLMLHVCGQFSVLALQVNELKNDAQGFRHTMKAFVQKHLRLIWMAKTLDASFNILLLQQLIGITMLLCLIGYNVIANSEEGQTAHLLTFLLYASSMILLLFGYCFIGECLICESIGLYDAFYNCEWYDMPTLHAKLFLICMARSQKPLQLTAGKFYVFSLSSFTGVVKTSMAYLSVLRKFL